MAIIGSIRKRSGLLVLIVGLALAAFILNDLFTKSRRRMPTNLAVIDGEKISYYDFEAKVKEQEESFKKQTGEEKIDQETRNQIIQQTWMQLKREIIFKKQYEKIGITVSEDEKFDMVQGKEPHAYVVRAFSDPKTGTFNANNVIEFLKTLDQREPEVKEQWYYIEKAIEEDRLSGKYLTLIKNGLYPTKSVSKRYYEEDNTKIDLRYIVKRYNEVTDSKIKITEDDLKKYYEEHKYEYEIEGGRDFEYVVFDVKPSNEDISFVKSKIEKIRANLDTVKGELEIIDFINNNSDYPYDSLYHKKGYFSPLVDSIIFKSKPGFIYGPYEEGGAFKIMRVMDITERPDSIKARHILIAYKDAIGNDKITRTKEEAKRIADSLKVILEKDSSKFNSLATTMSDDPSAKQNNGNLGMFGDQKMIKPFNEACINTKIGGITVVETVFGYHVLQVLDKKDISLKAKVGFIILGVEASKETYNSIYKKVNEFATTIVNNPDNFDNQIKKMGLTKRFAQNVKEADFGIPGLSNAREIVRWAYEAKKGDISKVFELDGDKYIIAKLKEIKEKGIAPFEYVRIRVEAMVKREKKGDLLKDELTKVIKNNNIKDIESLANVLNIKVDTLTDITFTNPSAIGNNYVLVGKIFVSPVGKLSTPVKDKDGVFVYYIDNKIKPAEINNIEEIRKQLRNQYLMKTSSFELYRALEDKTDIVDKRGKFY